MNPSAPTSFHYLRVEGVNLDRFVLDTRDLNTIRGGGLLLLNAARKQAKDELEKLSEPSTVTQISVGASIGLFSFKPKSGTSAAEARDEVAKQLRTDPQLKHATFVVDIVPVPADANGFRGASESVLAKNRWRQYQSSTLAIPEREDNTGESKPVCELDGVTPMKRRLLLREKDRRRKAVCASVRTRRSHGQDQKQNFYLEQAGLAKECLPLKFAQDFEDIAAENKGSRLNNKLAFFYADGNSFSDIQQNLCKTEPSQMAWDKFIRDSRKTWLKSFLENELTKSNGWIGEIKDASGQAKEFYRFETLMWGGDEVMFVMPAWKGWAFAQHFFGAVEKWNLDQAKIIGNDGTHSKFPSTPLTHTAALVFCHHHAPIHRIKKLAKDGMAEFAKGLKDSAGNKIGRKRNNLIYQVLESFDHLGADYEVAISKRVKTCCSAADLIVSANPAESLATKLMTTSRGIADLKKSDFPRSQLRASVLEVLEGGIPISDLKHEEFLKRMSKREENIRATLEALDKCFANHTAFWFHLEELWDYAAP